MTREERQALRERLAAERLALLEDIEAREQRELTDLLEQPPPRRAPSEMVFKDRQNGSVNGDNGITGSPPLDDDLIDAIAQALAEQRVEIAGQIDQMLAPLRERVASLEGQVQTLLSVIGGGNGGTRSKRAPRLLEAPK